MNDEVLIEEPKVDDVESNIGLHLNQRTESASQIETGEIDLLDYWKNQMSEER